MFFNQKMHEDAIDINDDSVIDAVLPKDPESAEGIDALADQVEDAMQAQALESVTFFEGGEEALDFYLQSPEVQKMLEAFPSASALKKTSFMTLSKKDDYKRRLMLASVLLAKENKDAAFAKYIKYKAGCRVQKRIMFQKYGKKAAKIARLSQKKHIIDQKHGNLPEVSAPAAKQ